MSDPNNIKIVIVGDGAIGKTCVMLRYTENIYKTEYTPTIFDNKVKTIALDNLLINLNLWDTAGQQAYSSLRKVAYPNTDIFLIAFSVVDPESFINAKKRWYPEVTSQVPNAKVLFVGTKADLRQPQIVSNKQLFLIQIQRNLQTEFNCKYRECSSLTGQGIQQLFNEAARVVLRKQGIIKESMKVSSAKSHSSKNGKTSQKEKENQEEGYCSTCELM